MDATMRGGTAQCRFIRESMDVNVAGVGIHVAAAIEARLQTFQPQDAMGDGQTRCALPSQADGFAVAKHGADGMARANLFGDAMQAQRSHVRISELAGAKSRSRDVVSVIQFVSRKFSLVILRPSIFKQPHHLAGHIHDEDEPCGPDVVAATGEWEWVW